METDITKNSLVSDLKKMGIKQGDVLFLRISYKAIGNVFGGPNQFISALLDAIGNDGTIVATAFPYVHNTQLRYLYRRNIFDNNHDLKSATGIISNMMIKNPASFISNHPTFPFVAIGKNASKIVGGHNVDSNPYKVIEMISDEFKGKCLRIGGDVLIGTTHVALTEGLIANNKFVRRAKYGIYYVNDKRQKKWCDVTSSHTCYRGFKDFFERRIKQDSVISEGTIGNGYAMLTDMNKSLNIERQILKKDPLAWKCSDPNCIICQVYYNYSFIRALKYLFNLLAKYFSCSANANDKKMIRDLIIRMIFGTKCQ